MEKRKKVSVALASYNGEKYIEEQIKSILNNLKENDELIISDDGSTDDTLKLIDDIKDKRIKLLKGPKKGLKKNFENAIKNAANEANNLKDLISNIKSKRYTYNKVKRMLTHILCGFTKEEASRNKSNEYIRILGFNKAGKEYLNKAKKKSDLPIITGYSNIKSEILDIERRVSSIYFLPFKQKNKNYLMEMEYKHKPIIK
jgi:predicted nucleotidyltransferase